MGEIMDKSMIISHKRHSSNNDDKRVKYLKNLISRTLISIIMLFGVGIYIKLDSKNIDNIHKYLLSDSLKFTKINNWYHDKIGNLVPKINNNNTSLVMSSEELKTKEYEKYKDGIKIKVNKSTPISLLNGGIVVFIGNKDDYGNVITIQGNDGIDYYYGNISNTNVNLYDYLEKDTLIGEAHDDYIYLVLKKDGNNLKYEKYLEEN